MSPTQSVWIRPILALIGVLTASYDVIINVTPPTWYVVLVVSMISFYFGHVNGRAEQSTTQAGDIAQAALRKVVDRPLTRASDATEVTQ